MSRTRTIAIAGALIATSALALQYVLQFRAMPGVAPLAVTWRYFGYFTILTNMLVASVWSGAALNRGGWLNGPRTEGLAFTAIAMVGILYHALLASRWHPAGWQWIANFGVHTLTPVLFGVYWLARPHGALKWRDAALFLLWPLGYCVYALVRGGFDGWYAYYFLNPATTAPAQLALNILAQGAGFMFAGLIVIAADKGLLRPFSRSPQPDASPSAP